MNWGAGFRRPDDGSQSNGGTRVGHAGQQGLQWGAGFQGQNSSQNRFAALDHPPAKSAHDRGARQNSGGGSGWRQIILGDCQQERPLWPCSSYSHIKAAAGQQGGGNDFEGDFCAEELRWAQMQAAAQGTPASQLGQEMHVARNAQDKQWQALSTAGQPPSLGGPRLPNLASLLPSEHSLLKFASSGQPSAGFNATPSTPFGQVISAFGKFPSVAANTGPPSVSLGVGVAHMGGGFGSAVAQNNSTSHPQEAGIDHLASIPEPERVWVQNVFEKGKIPDAAPPQIYCT